MAEKQANGLTQKPQSNSSIQRVAENQNQQENKAKQVPKLECSVRELRNLSGLEMDKSTSEIKESFSQGRHINNCAQQLKGHNGTVKILQQIDPQILLSCSYDGLMNFWKYDVVQNENKKKQSQKIFSLILQITASRDGVESVCVTQDFIVSSSWNTLYI